MTLRFKLFFWILLIISASTLLSAIIYYNNVSDLLNKQIKNEHKNDTAIVKNHLENVKNNLKFLANDISMNNEIISSLNLIVNYQDKNNYNSFIFEAERYSIIDKLSKWLASSNNTSITLFDTQKQLIASSTRLLDNTQSYIASFDENGKFIVLDSQKKIIPNNQFDKTQLKHSITGYSTSKISETQFEMCYTMIIYYLDKPLGYLHLCYLIDNTVLETLRKNTVHEIVFEYDNKDIISSNSLAPVTWENAKKQRYYIASNSKVLEAKDKLTYWIITNKKIIKDQLKETIILTVLLGLSVFIATFFVSLIIVKKYILDPVGYLKEALHTIYPSKSYDQIASKYEGDELSQIRNEINHIGTNLKKNIAFLKSYKELMDEGSMISKSDLEGRITYVNERFLNATGYELDEIMDKPHNILRSPDTAKKVYEKMWNTIKNKNTWRGILKSKRKDGTYFWTKTVISPILDENDEIVEYIAMRNDITEIIEQRKELERIATSDILTGLPNRYKLIQTLKDEKAQMLCILNIDNFRQINDFYGHEFGDKVIVTLGQSIHKYIIDIDHWQLFHLRADEFVLICTKCKNKEQTISLIKNLQNHIHHQSLLIDSQLISLRISIGLSFEEPQSLLLSADIALKYAKKESKDMVIYSYDNPLQKEYENNIKWSEIIETALKNDKVVPYFQAIFNNQTKKIEKFESLVRLIDESDNVISPYFFLDIAKKTKLYKQITKKVIEKSFKAFQNSPYEFSINLSIEDILDREINMFIMYMLDSYNVGQQVVFEIVESESIENFEEIHKFIQNVKSYGCKIAIDDFGTGYSNFEYLMKLNADYVKIDGSMIKNINVNKNAQLVVSTIVNFSKQLGMKTIAEFVEDEKIQAIVEELGIDYSQGYLHGKPEKNIYHS